MVLGLGCVVVIVGVFFVIASRPVGTQDFAFIAGQGQEFHLDEGGVVSNAPQLISRATGGILLGVGVALAAGVGGFLLGRRRR